MMERDKLRKADVVASAVLIVLGLTVILYTTTMPQSGTHGGVENVWYVSPAVFPYLIGFLLICSSTVVLIRALKDGGAHGIVRHFAAALRGLPSNRTVHRIWAIWILVGIYVFALFGKFDFYVAGFVFLSAFMLIFHRDHEGRLTLRNSVTALVLGAAVPATVGYVFSTYLLVPLP